MNVMDLFKKAPAATEPAANKPAVADPAAATPAKPAADPNKPQDSENPLDTYQKLFDNANKNSDIQAPTFSLDPAVLKDVSSKMDFTKGINPEIVQKAKDGDAAALMQMIQQVGQNSYHAALEHATKLTDTHLTQRTEFENKRVQKGVKQQLTADALSSADNPNYNHPVVKAELNRIAGQLANSPEYVDASPQDIAQAAKKYMDDLHAAMNPTKKGSSEDSKGNKGGEVDYMKYLGQG